MKRLQRLRAVREIFKSLCKARATFPPMLLFIGAAGLYYQFLNIQALLQEIRCRLKANNKAMLALRPCTEHIKGFF